MKPAPQLAELVVVEAAVAAGAGALCLDNEDFLSASRSAS